MPEKYFIAGLGNPGRKYTWTRHNLGFLVLEKLAENLGIKFKKSSLTNGVVAELKGDEKNLYLLMPHTYVNLSGGAIARLIEKKEIEHENLLVVCDDVNIPFSHMRLRSKGSSGGHNGLKSISEHLNTQMFARLRLGVGHPGEEMVDFVLGEFSKAEKKELPQFIDEAKDACLEWLEKGTLRAMERVNRRKENGKD